MRDALLDVLKHTHSLGFFERLRVSAAEDSTIIDGMDDNRTILLKAVLKTPLKDFQGVFGMQRLQILQGFLNFPTFKTEGSRISVKNRETSEGSVPEEITFFGADDAESTTYRFLAASFLPNMGTFIGKEWDVRVTPARSKVLEFMQLAGIMMSEEDWFSILTANGKLIFNIGGTDESTADRCNIVIDNNVPQKLADNLFWHTKQIIQVLKLGIEENVELKITNRGALELAMETEFAKYSYTLPARSR
jgi:hypothetical protein